MLYVRVQEVNVLYINSRDYCLGNYRKLTIFILDKANIKFFLRIFNNYRLFIRFLVTALVRSC